MNLIIKCDTAKTSGGFRSRVEVEIESVDNIDEIAEAIAEEADPAVLVTRRNKDGLLDNIGEDYVKKYFNLIENLDKAV